MSCLETFKRILARDQMNKERFTTDNGTIDQPCHQNIEKHIINLHNDMYDFHGCLTAIHV